MFSALGSGCFKPNVTTSLTVYTAMLFGCNGLESNPCHVFSLFIVSYTIRPAGKRPLGRPRRRWEDNIKMDLKEVGRGCGDWMELAEDRDSWRALVSTAMNFRVP